MEQVISKLELTKEQCEKFSLYYDFLISENEKYNLTAITNIDEVYIKHFYDSIMMGKFIDLNGKSLCDIGSGAGFPSIPLKIVFPELEVVIIEPTQKRIKFLEQLINKLKLENVKLVCERAEDAICNYRESFDIVTARAVSNLRMLLELTIPFVKVNGDLIAYKGSSYKEEIDISKSALQKLNSQVIYIHKYNLPYDMGERYLIQIKKNKKTDEKFPRRFSEIKKKPL